MVRPGLAIFEDSGLYRVYVLASPGATTVKWADMENAVARLGFGADASGQLQVDASDSASRQFILRARAACAEGRSPWAAVTDH
jgi:hypothetical protein